MSASETTERYVLESLVPRYVAEGFDVFVHPSPSILPPFMQNDRPDAIAISPNRKITIELVRPSRSTDTKTKRLQQAIAQHQDWELRLFHAVPHTAEAIEVASRSSIARAIDRVVELKAAGQNGPALIMAWATLEAIARALLPEKFERPQIPGRLVEVLAHEGYITPQEADTLRPAISLRNEVVHGGLDSAVEAKLLDAFVDVLRTLANFVR